VFVNETPETVARIMLDAGLDVAQLHGSSDARGGRIWRAMSPVDPGALALFGDVEAVLIDSPSDSALGGTGKTWDWARAPHLEQKVIIAGGLDADNVRLAIEQARPWGVDACSRIEKSPGLKDHYKMRKFILAALES
jgi:phosphoribosylanthranilate isomerase